ncbi:LicD family protein [Methanobrevibacter sp.]
MSVHDKLKNKILSKSGSYNHYKAENESLAIDLKNELDDLKKEFANYKALNDKILNSYNDLFNNLFLDFEIKPKGALRYTQELSIELLDLFVNICRKHDFEYWLDGGNLIGAVRHEGFIPWDDDLDVCMMRRDCVRFNDIIDDEIKQLGLNDVIDISKQRINHNNRVFPFTQLKITSSKALYSGLDVFPNDFIANPGEDIEKQFKKARKTYRNMLFEGMSKNEVIEEYYSLLGCSWEYQDYFLPCIEGKWGTRALPFKLFRSDKVFPLTDIGFCGKTYKAPGDAKYYLSEMYGDDFMRIPKIVDHHTRIINLKKDENFKENFKVYFKRLKEANSRF